MLNVSPKSHEPEEYSEEYYDDVSGVRLDSKMVKSARADEMKKFNQHEVYSKWPISEHYRDANGFTVRQERARARDRQKTYTHTYRHT